MNKNNILYGAAGLIIGTIIGVFIAPSFILQGPGYTGMMWRGGGERFMSGAIDRRFIEQMIPHHEGAIAMAGLALERSQQPEILSFAEGIIDAQTREIAQMRDWYQQWFTSDVPEYGGTGMGMMGGGPMMSFEGDLDELREAEDFDLAFIRQMVPHHEMAVMMAAMLAAGSGREEMQALADQIATSQSREIDMMRSWYAALSVDANN